MNEHNSENCAVDNHGGNAGGWWYGHCSHIHLNHQYNHIETIYLNGKACSLPFNEIKIKPYKC